MTGCPGRWVTEQRTDPSVGEDTRRARFQPLLLLGAVATVLPPAIIRGAPGVVVGYLVVCGLLATVLAVGDRRRPMSAAQRDVAALGLILTALVGLVLVVWGDHGEHPEDHLFLVAAFACAVASTPVAWLRWSLQGVVLLLVLADFVAAQRPVADTVFVLVLVLAVASLIEMFARALVEARRSSLVARRHAANRAELLDAVRTLPGRSVGGAARAVTDAVQAMGFDAAAIVRVEDGFLRPIGRAGDLAIGAIPRGYGATWAAIEEGETVLETDLQQEDHLRELAGFRSAVISPLRVDGEPVGCLVGAYRVRCVPNATQIEIVEVLAAHFSGVLAADARVARQTELMERMAALDRMRRGLVTTVSTEVRDPLTIVRGIGQLLSTHGARISASQRHHFLEQLVQQSDHVRQLIETLLDFSRSQAQRDDPRVRPTPLVELLAPFVDATGARLTPNLEELARRHTIVELDATLVRSALELLVDGRSSDGGVAAGGNGGPGTSDRRGPGHLPADVEVVLPSENSPDNRSAEVQLRIHRRTGPPASDLVVSLVEQLCVAGNVAPELGEVPVVRLPLGAFADPSVEGERRSVDRPSVGEHA